MRSLYAYLLFFLPLIGKADTVDYNDYHKLVNTAEVHYFIDNNIDSALYNYDIAFAFYDMVFARDCMIAIQIAVENKKNADAYLIKAFENGVTPEHLRKINFLKENKDVDRVANQAFATARIKYLKRINVNYLNWLMDFAIEDQCMKVKPNDLYYTWLLNKYDSLKVKIKDWGFPGDFIIGLGQENIFQELKSNNFSLNERIDTVKRRDINYFKTEGVNMALCAPFIDVLIYHYACGYMYFEKEIKQAIKNGNLHPRDAAAMHDFMFYLNARGFKYCTDYGPYYLNDFYGVNVYGCEEAAKRGRAKKGNINICRRKIGLNSIDVDEAKRMKEKELGMKLFYGYSGCR